jgi:hypothetical protein
MWFIFGSVVRFCLKLRKFVWFSVGISSIIFFAKIAFLPLDVSENVKIVFDYRSHPEFWKSYPKCGALIFIRISLIQCKTSSFQCSSPFWNFTKNVIFDLLKLPGSDPRFLLTELRFCENITKASDKRKLEKITKF